VRGESVGRRGLARLGLLALIAALGLSACGAPPAPSWPGVAANDEFAFIANNRQVHAIRLSDGKQAWSFPAAVNNQSDLFLADPGLSPEILVIGSEGPPNSYSGVLVGLDPATGRQRWCLAFDRQGVERHNCPQAPSAPSRGIIGISAPADNRIIGGITLADGVVYVGLANARVYAVDALEGTVKWHFDSGHAVWAAPAVDGEAVYVTSLDHYLYALARADGALRWKKDLGAAMAGTPAVAEGRLFVGTFGNRLYALDAATGEEIWPPVQTNHWVWGGPVVREGAVYFTDLSGAVSALDARTGSQKWSTDLGSNGNDLLRASPLVTSDTLYVGNRAGRLFALNSADGSVRWSVDVGGQLLATPVSTNDMILVAPYNGANLLAAYTTAGVQQWAFAPSN
jgi:outer membrane protein assembly factor BamB